MTDKVHISMDRCFTLASVVAQRIHAANSRVGRILNIYGVPRGGIAPALMVAQFLQVLGYKATVVGDPNLADYFVDDLIDSGTTRDNYTSLFNTPFFALVDKQNDTDFRNKWLVFPWELKDGDIDESAWDIPIRLLQYIGEDLTRPGLVETPMRYIAAWDEYTAGYRVNVPGLLKTFTDGAEHYNEMVIVRDIPVYSHCEHHLAPFFGKAHVAYIPNGKVVGLSKIPRLVDAYARRLQVQERLTQEIAHALQGTLAPIGVGVTLECRHLCMESRGIRAPGTSTVTTCVLGALKSDAAARAEFLGLIR